jgi:hypothetical protein
MVDGRVDRAVMGMRVASGMGQRGVFFHVPADSVYMSPVAAKRGIGAIQPPLAVAGQRDFCRKDLRKTG